MFPSNYCILFFPFHSYKNSLNLCLKNLDYHKHHFLLLLYFLYRQSKNRECDNRLLSLQPSGHFIFRKVTLSLSFELIGFMGKYSPCFLHISPPYSLFSLIDSPLHIANANIPISSIFFDLNSYNPNGSMLFTGLSGYVYRFHPPFSPIGS